MKTQNRLKMMKEEPFRVFFPLGIILGLSGVLLWPLYEFGWIQIYPSIMHSRVLILGFIGSFVLGFLGTAFPRLLGVKTLNKFEFAGCSFLQLLSQVAYLMNLIAIGDMVAFVLWSLAIITALIRLLDRKDIPPPGFILVAVSILSLWISLALRVYAIMLHEFALWSFSLSRIFMNETFPVLIILGVAPYFFPKILGGANDHEFETTKTPSPRWIRLAIRSFAASTLAIIGFIWKTQNEAIGACIVSFAVSIYIWMEIPLTPRTPKHKGSMSLGLLLGMTGILLGSVFPVFFPGYRIGIFHTVMLGGVTIILMIVSLRVVHGHAGVPSNTNGWKKRSITIPALLVIASITRLSADVLPSTRSSHLIYAALIFAISALMWLWITIPYLFREDCDA